MQYADISLWRPGLLGNKSNFKPTALYLFIGMQVQKLTLTFLHAEEVWGNKVQLICEQFNGSTYFNMILKLIESFIEELVKRVWYY